MILYPVCCYRARRLVGALMVLLVGGCSFHSNQWNALTSLWHQQEQGPQKNWQVEWSTRVIDVFAINAGKEIIFADGDGLLVRFDGQQVRQVKGLLPNDDTLYIEPESATDEELLTFSYSSTGSRFGKISCTVWKLVKEPSAANQRLSSVYEQKCAATEAAIIHSLTLNKDKQLMALSFTLHPAYPPASIRYLGN